MLPLVRHLDLAMPHHSAWRPALAPFLVVTLSLPVRAQSATQTITIAVNAINQIAFVGSPALSITTATPGSPPTSATDASANWAVTTNQTGAKITASIPAAMPAGLTLSAMLSPPAGATSSGFQPLGTIAVDQVTGIAKLAQSAMGVSYRLDATTAAGVINSATRVVTYTITGGV